MVNAVREADPLQCLRGGRASLPCGHAAVQQTGGDVVQRVH
jgi:hypothetical protein